MVRERSVTLVMIKKFRYPVEKELIAAAKIFAAAIILTVIIFLIRLIF